MSQVFSLRENKVGIKERAIRVRVTGRDVLKSAFRILDCAAVLQWLRVPSLQALIHFHSPCITNAAQK